MQSVMESAYTRDQMARRPWAFVLVIVLISGPIAAGVCGATCASAGERALPSQTHHHSCAPSGTTLGAAVDAAPHTCGHSPDDPVSVQQALQLLTAPALVILHRSLFPPFETAVFAAHKHDIDHRPPGTLDLPSQLRV
jgi:hypothetical protein